MLSLASRRIATSAVSSRFLSTTAAATPDLVVSIEKAFPDEPTNGASIAILTMSRHASRNALGKQMLGELVDALDTLPNDSSLRCVILQSDVARVFCAGADLKERRDMTQQEAGIFVSKLRGSFTQLANLPLPVIASVEGAALGGGLEIALGADIRVAGSDAIFGLPETGLAIIPGAGGTQRLPRLIGEARAKELMFTGRRVNAADAEAYGIVNHTVPAGSALEKSMDIAREIARNGPIGVRMAKLAVNTGLQCDITSGMEIERACYAQTIPTEDRLEGLNAFREKRKPVYQGK
jgi:methylglutaconyl-CoA hydratase